MFKLFSLVQNRKELKKHERVCNGHDYCFVEMPNEDNKILKYNYGEKSLKCPAFIYADLVFAWKNALISKWSWKILYGEKTKHTPSVYSLFTNCLFGATKNKLDCYKEKDCIRRFCKDLREDAIKTSTAAVEPQHLKVEVAD